MSESESEPITIRCRTCDGVAHPVTGCVYSPTFIVCGPCVRSFWSWAIKHVNGKGRRKGPSFYDHVNRIAPMLTVTRDPVAGVPLFHDDPSMTASDAAPRSPSRQMV